MKTDYEIKIISKKEAGRLLKKHHYLSKIAAGCFGLQRDGQDGLYELSRLVMCPETQKKEHNITSWFVARCLRQMKNTHKARAILSYADTDHHRGTIYRACNFQYYGMTEPKKDFYVKVPDLFEGERLQKNSRGSVSGLDGEWLPRSRKHRFLIVWDKKLKVMWEPKNYEN